MSKIGGLVMVKSRLQVINEGGWWSCGHRLEWMSTMKISRSLAVIMRKVGTQSEDSVFFLCE